MVIMGIPPPCELTIHYNVTEESREKSSICEKDLCAVIAAKIVQIYHFLAYCVKMCYHYKQRCQVLE